MCRPTYVHVLNINKFERTIKRFDHMADAIAFVRRFRCKGHCVYAERYDEILAYKSDTVCFSGSRV